MNGVVKSTKDKEGSYSNAIKVLKKRAEGIYGHSTHV